MRSTHSVCWGTRACRRWLVSATLLGPSVAALLVTACASSSNVTTGPIPAKCQIALAMTANNMESSGGTGSLQVSTQPECTWKASTAADWITDLSPSSGQGSAEVTFRIVANPQSSPRQGDIVINDERIRVAQSAAPCRFEIDRGGQDIAAAGGVTTVGLTTENACSWTTTTSADWMSVTPATGSSSDTVTITVAGNAGGQRTGTVAIADQTFTVRQLGASDGGATCPSSISPTSLSVQAAGVTGSTVSVTAGQGCAWTAISLAPWITITSGSSGNAGGSVTFNVGPNTGAARTGTITIAGHQFSVSQAAAPAPPTCTFTIAPTSQSVAASGGTGTVAVTTTSGCAWTATSNAAWLSITSGASGTASGSVGFSAQTNTGAARTGTLSIAGATFTVTQAAAPAPCTFTIAPTSQAVAATGGTGTVGVTTTSGCAWTATSNTAWLTITSGASGTGNGSVGFSAQPNTGAARTGTLTVAGATFTVTQAAAACAFAIAPTSQSVAATGGTGTVGVTTTSVCAWTATSNTGWLTITSGASGTGNGSVGFSAQPNTGAARTGTLTIAGATFTVTQQAAPCVYVISPTAANFGAGGDNNFAIGVTTSSHCTWSATSNASWITINSGASGTGSGNVRIRVASNGGTTRTGTVTIAGQTFTATQQAK